jgi:phosphoenolpyruvate-protein kinase (PTS system EI component)
MTLKIDPQKSFKLSLDGTYSKLLGKAEIIRDIIKSLPENEIIENKKELLSFAKSLEKLLNKLENQNTKKVKELAKIIDEIIEFIITPLEDEWLGNTLIQNIDEENVSLDEVFKELNK